MTMKSRAFTMLLPLALFALPAGASDALQELRARLDKAAADFHAMTAQVVYITHTAVLDENMTETGNVVMKKLQAGEVQGLVDFVTPDKRTVTFEKRRLQIFYPKAKLLDIWDLDKHGDQLDQFLMIGFGTSGTSLARDYGMKVLGTEPVKEQQGATGIRLELIPKDAEARKYVTKVELWLPQTGDPYPLQEKISQPSGDYRLVLYKDLKINPVLKPDALELKLPPGVKKEYPGK